LRLWSRRWRVRVGTLESTEIDLRFSCERSLRMEPGKLELELFNLSADHRSQMEQARRPEVEVEAGYAEGAGAIFRGNARKVGSVREGAEWSTRVAAGDGEHAIRTARAARSFGPGSPVQDVVRYLAEQMSVGIGNASEAIADAALNGARTFPEGTTVRGLASRELGLLLASAGLSWSIQGGVLQVLPMGGALQRTAVLLRQDTGLVGVPERKANRTVEAVALLIPDLVPGRLVRLESGPATGTYRIEHAAYAGDTRGDDWYATLTLREAAG